MSTAQPLTRRARREQVIECLTDIVTAADDMSVLCYSETVHRDDLAPLIETVRRCQLDLLDLLDIKR